MSAAPYFHKLPQPHRQPPATSTKGRHSRKRRTSPPLPAGNKLKNFPPTAESLPVELRAMLLLQRGSAAIATSLVAATLALYGWTVYAPKQWSAEFKKLATLERQERHLTATNETLKDLYAEQAQKPGSGLIQPHPTQAIVLPAAATSLLSPGKTSLPPTNQPPFPSTPFAY